MGDDLPTALDGQFSVAALGNEFTAEKLDDGADSTQEVDVARSAFHPVDSNAERAAGGPFGAEMAPTAVLHTL